jgi:hypothetical protein
MNGSQYRPTRKLELAHELTRPGRPGLCPGPNAGGAMHLRMRVVPILSYSRDADTQ